MVFEQILGEIIIYQLFIIQKSPLFDSLGTAFLIIIKPIMEYTMRNKALNFFALAAAMMAVTTASANESCETVIDPVAKLSCWIKNDKGVAQPMGPGSGGTGGNDEEAKKTTE